MLLQWVLLVLHCVKSNAARLLPLPKVTGMMTNIDYAAELAFFLLEKTGSVCGTWHGKLTAAEQRTICGRVIGRGTIVINGADETVLNRVKVCFGLDWDDRNVTTWRALNAATVAA